jgi:hypothetical protein
MHSFDKRTILMVFALLWSSMVWAAFTPSENPSGIRWESASSESWSGSAQSRSEGILLHLAGTFDTSVDTINGAGVTGFLGLLDPILGQVSATPTDTPMLEPTATPMVTVSPTVSDMPTEGPSATPTDTPMAEPSPSAPCIADVDDAVFNLDGINGIDGRDLLLLYGALKDDNGTPFDLDCSGDTDILDLIQFSQHWQTEIP